jgi:hypothetical protein
MEALLEGKDLEAAHKGAQVEHRRRHNRYRVLVRLSSLGVLIRCAVARNVWRIGRERHLHASHRDELVNRVGVALADGLDEHGRDDLERHCSSGGLHMAREHSRISTCVRSRVRSAVADRATG